MNKPKRSAKTAAKTPAKAQRAKGAVHPSGVEMAPPEHGGGLLLKGGLPGNKGGTDRPPNWLREWCDDLLANENNKAQVEAVLANNKHPAFATMWRTVAERAHGKPVQPISGVSDEPLTIVVRDEKTGTTVRTQAGGMMGIHEERTDWPNDR